MGKENIFLQQEASTVSMKASGKMAKETEKADSNTKLAKYTRDISKIVS